MFEYNPMHYDPDEPERVYRGFAYGPLLDVIMLDERTYRADNRPNDEATYGPKSRFLGAEHIAWVKRRLLSSRATWKVVASDMPLSSVVADSQSFVPKGWYEGFAQGEHGTPLGREYEIAALLSFIRANGIRNVVWVTADVRYAQAIHYSPERGKFADFMPFWEFISGPINAGTFGRNDVDGTFGPEVKFTSIPADMKPIRPPTEGCQFFAQAEIDGGTEVMTVSFKDLNGKELFSHRIEPEV